MTYNVVLHAYCGMSLPLAEGVSLEAALQRVRKRNAWARKQGCPVERLGKWQWEHQEPDDCVMVPDFCGVLTIERPPVRR